MSFLLSTFKFKLNVLVQILLTTTLLSAHLINLNPKLEPDKDQYKFEGEEMIVNCITKERVSLRWHGPGDHLDIGRVMKNNESDKLRLFIETVQKKDAGLYTCTANNNATIYSEQFNLHVYSKINFNGSDTIVTKELGTNTQLKCQLNLDSNTRNVEVEWLFNDQPIKNFKEFKQTSSGVNTHYLNIYGVKKEHEGTYLCKVIVDFPQASQSKRHYIELKTGYKPIFDMSKQILWVDRKKSPGHETVKSIELKCSCQAEPKANLTWKDPQDTILDGKYITSNNSSDNRYTSVLSLKYIPSHIDCIAANTLGSAKKMFVIQEGELPPQVSIKKHEYVEESRTLKLTVSLAENGKRIIPEIDMFRVRTEDQIMKEGKLPLMMASKKLEQHKHDATTSEYDTWNVTDSSFPQNFTVELKKVAPGKHSLYLEAHNAVGWALEPCEIGPVEVASSAHRAAMHSMLYLLIAFMTHFILMMRTTLALR